MRKMVTNRITFLSLIEIIREFFLKDSLIANNFNRKYTSDYGSSKTVPTACLPTVSISPVVLPFSVALIPQVFSFVEFQVVQGEARGSYLVKGNYHRFYCWTGITKQSLTKCYNR